MKNQPSKKQNIAARFVRFLWEKGPGSIEEFSKTHGFPLSKRKLLADSAYQLEKAGTLAEQSRKKKNKVNA